LSEDALANVAGGTTEQNAELLNALMQIDPKAVADVINNASAKAGSESYAHALISEGIEKILNHHFNVVAMPSGYAQNYYWDVNGNSRKPISHETVLNMINAKANGWDFKP
jgi:hypothetical protein